METMPLSLRPKSIGIMQGRLLPRYLGKYQAFPKGYWEAEFHIAREFDLQHIEFIVDSEDIDENPLLSKLGIETIANTVRTTGTRVLSICADFLMNHSLHSGYRDDSENRIIWLIQHSVPALGVKEIVIPCVDQSSLKSDQDCALLIESVQKLSPIALQYNCNLCLETDLSPRVFSNLLDLINRPNVTVNYDIGNSASLGFDPREELEHYGHQVSLLHIKDRLLGGKSVPLGTGNAKFEVVFQKLNEKKFSGVVTFQAARAEEYRDEFDLIMNQLNFAMEWI